MKQSEYDLYVEIIQDTIIEQVNSIGWHETLDETGILVKSAEIVGEFWELDTYSYEELIKVVNRLKREYE